MKLDDDRSGRVEIGEFRTFASKHGQQKICEKVTLALLRTKNFFCIEDVMRIMWPCATNTHVKMMKGWVEEYHSKIIRVKTPPLIPAEERLALEMNFKYFDQTKDGMVSFSELVESGLVDKEQAERWMQEHDDGSGELDLQ